MSIKGMSLLSLGVACAAITAVPTTQALATTSDFAQSAGQAAPMSKVRAISNFQTFNQYSGLTMRQDGSVGRVYGRAFSHGQTAEISASRFLQQHLSMWNVPQDQLVAEGPFQDAAHQQQIGYNPDTNSYKFTGHYYKQVVDGLPVFRSKLVLLTRNEANNPMVLASSELHDLGNFQVAQPIKRMPINHGQIEKSAAAHFNLGTQLLSSERMIYAGTESAPHAPTIADVSKVQVNGFEEHLVITDAQTGEVLFTESLIHTLDISGNVSAPITQGIGSDNCEPEVSQPLPYLHVNGPSGTATTDINGNYTLSNPGTTAVNVDATLSGQWFEIFDWVGSVESQSQSVTPPGPSNFVFNAANGSENARAQVNAYREANIVRDHVIDANPAYPGMNFQMDVWVNRTDGFCPGNAWYSPGEQSINFCLSGSSNPNTAWSSVVHHEYGHHIVNVGGSGQGQYGEGFGDVMSVIVLDDNRVGNGFFGSCGSSLRNAVNTLQYPCATDGHACAGLLSGAVWETRNAMVDSSVPNYTELLGYLAINSVLVHSGSTITPQITIDWLTLDDDDADIGNGTPHYAEIAEGFGSKNMDAPALNLYAIAYPEGLPEMVSPDGDTTLSVNFNPISASVDPSTAMLMVDSGSGFVAVPMTQNTSTNFTASFPAVDCGSQINYYIASESSGGAEQNSPTGAPDAGFFSAISAYSAPVVAFEDNFETDKGWTVTGTATDGQWDRGIPAAGNRGDPGSDFDGSGQCYVTDNVAGNSDVDGGVTELNSPVMDASNGNNVISYARWYDNTAGDSPMADTFIVDVSDNAGASWTNLETVGPGGAEVSGGWYAKQFALNDIPGFTPNNQFMIRFRASDIGAGSVVEAGVDAVELLSFDCTGGPTCNADLNGDGELDFFDISEYLTLYSAGDLAADFNNDGALDFFDISAFLTEFSGGCP
ncbi:MAG: GC-type dockerin domain-anchored protein [Phycisphaerales bacterium]